MLAISYGGDTPEILNLLDALKRLEIPIVTLTGNPKSALAGASEVVLDVSVKEEACTLNLAPTASTTVAMAMGDALAIALLDRRGFKRDDFAALHPAGRLGKKLLRVEHLMHTGDAVPRVSPETPMRGHIPRNVREEVGNDDGDPRGWKACRNSHRWGFATVDGKTWRRDTVDGRGDCMVRTPQTIQPSLLASEALNLMEKKKITSVVVVDAETEKVVGVVHLHDLWTLEVI